MPVKDQPFKQAEVLVPVQGISESAAERELAQQMQMFRQKEKVAANTVDVLPSGKKVERMDDGYPVGGRTSFGDMDDDRHWADREMWSYFSERQDLSAQEKAAASAMWQQLDYRLSDPGRDNLIMHGTWDERINAAQKSFDAWTMDSKILAGKFNPQQKEIAATVSDELQTELWQEQWRKKRFEK